MSEMDTRPEVLVVGHRNPDTDSICAAIGYAALKNELDPTACYVACRAGDVSRETDWVLRRFGLEEPRLLEDVAPTVADVEIRRIPGVDASRTIKEAWELMRDGDISTLPVVNAAGRLEGVVTLKDLALTQMDKLDARSLARAGTPLSAVAKTLSGTVVTGDPNRVMTKGRALVGAGTVEAICGIAEPGDLVLVADREEAQRAAVEDGAGAVVVCLSGKISPAVRALAQERGCVLITTPLDTYQAVNYINQSIPIRHCMVRDVRCFTLSTPLEDAIRLMGSVRYVYFPVLDEQSRYYGVISRRNLINRSRKQLILVDHNEKAQCVPGWERAEIREIVDHHRIGGLATIAPIFFRNQPVGSTATIVGNMYRESGRTPEKAVAGALCCAILSDTLMFRSPTCTATDRRTAQWLADTAGTELEPLGEAMFAAGEDLTGKSPRQVLTGDYKEFAAGEYRFGVGQASFLSPNRRAQAAALVAPELEAVRRESGLDWVFFLLTDISRGFSQALWAGPGAESLAREAFSLSADAEPVLPGVVSRKKQFIPAVMETIHRRSEENKIQG